MISILTISLFLVNILLCNAADKGEHVIELDKNSFKQLVVDRIPWDYFLVEFYSPICSACKNFAPEYARIGEYLRGIMKVGRLNIHPEEHKDIINEYKVLGVPHISLFLSNNDVPVHYDAARTPVAIIKWILTHFDLLHLDVTSIDDYLGTDFSHEVYPSRFLLLHTGDTLGAYIALAENKKDSAFFAEVDVSEMEGVMTVGSLNLTSYPVLVVRKALHGTGEQYVTLNTDWQGSLKEFWDDIDSEVLETLQNRSPFVTFQKFTFLFAIFALCMVAVYYLLCISRKQKIW